MTGTGPAESADPDFARIDETPDEMFYGMPRLLTHLDEHACAALAAFYDSILKDGDQILDLMSSCVSHLPATLQPARVVGHGMNRTELSANPQLNEFFVQNLNRTPRLAIENGAFDACLVAVSIQYLIDPVAVLSEIGRILKPGGVIAISFSNRMFPTKAVAIWREAGNAQHGELVADYIRQAGLFGEVNIENISPRPGQSDPLFVVSARAN